MSILDGLVSQLILNLGHTHGKTDAWMDTWMDGWRKNEWQKL